MKQEMQIKLTLPSALFEKLQEVQQHLMNDLQPGEKVPSIEELIIDAVSDCYGIDHGRFF